MITAEELLDKYQKEFDENGIVFDLKKPMIEFARLNVEAALLAASEQAKTIKGDMTFLGGTIYKVDKRTILNAYPKELII